MSVFTAGSLQSPFSSLFVYDFSKPRLQPIAAGGQSARVKKFQCGRSVAAYPELRAAARNAREVDHTLRQARRELFGLESARDGARRNYHFSLVGLTAQSTLFVAVDFALWLCPGVVCSTWLPPLAFAASLIGAALVITRYRRNQILDGTCKKASAECDALRVYLDHLFARIHGELKARSSLRAMVQKTRHSLASVDKPIQTQLDSLLKDMRNAECAIVAIEHAAQSSLPGETDAIDQNAYRAALSAQKQDLIEIRQKRSKLRNCIRMEATLQRLEEYCRQVEISLEPIAVGRAARGMRRRRAFPVAR